MSAAHDVLFDLLRAPYLDEDPGDTKTLRPTRDRAVFEIVTAAAETRTLAVPTKAGLITTVVLDVDGGTLTLTVTSGYNADADTSITLADAGDFVTFIAIKIGANFRWRVLAQEGTNVALEDFAVDNLTVTAITLGGTLITATGAELNNLDGVILDDMAATAGVGITGAADSFASKVEKIGTLFKTTIVIDIDGLNCGGTADDIIGDDGTGAASLGQITAARNGTIFAGTLRCIEAPTTGDEDIDLWSADAGAGVEDTAMSAQTGEIKHTDGGNLAAGTEVPLTTYPADTQFLYLACGTSTAGEYASGILVIELWGK